jgi:hypothetical protein
LADCRSAEQFPLLRDERLSRALQELMEKMAGRVMVAAMTA